MFFVSGPVNRPIPTLHSFVNRRLSSCHCWQDRLSFGLRHDRLSNDHNHGRLLFGLRHDSLSFDHRYSRLSSGVFYSAAAATNKQSVKQTNSFNTTNKQIGQNTQNTRSKVCNEFNVHQKKTRQQQGSIYRTYNLYFCKKKTWKSQMKKLSPSLSEEKSDAKVFRLIV